MSEEQKSRYGGVLKNGTLADAYQRHLADPEFKSLSDEIAIMRAFTEAAVLALNGVDIKNLTPSMCGVVMTMVSEVRALVEAMARVDQKISVTMTVTDLQAVVVQIFRIIETHVKDPMVLQQIAVELDGIGKIDPGTVTRPDGVIGSVLPDSER